MTNSTLLRINVGFIVNQAIGYSRDFSFEIPEFSFSEDFKVKNLVSKITVSRTTEGLLVQVNGYAQTSLECSYCLEGFEKNLKFKFVEMYTFPSQAVEDTELILPDHQHLDRPLECLRPKRTDKYPGSHRMTPFISAIPEDGMVSCRSVLVIQKPANLLPRIRIDP